MAQQTDISKMETTQTAVEWLEEKYHYLLVEADINDMHVVEFDKKRNELFEQAKAMEKEQIINADLNATIRTAKGFNADVSVRRVKELARILQRNL